MIMVDIELNLNVIKFHFSRKMHVKGEGRGVYQIPSDVGAK